ncbi:MAG: hypothetical protein HN704_09870 [Bacteroidetes bacterium]|jgi:hypothetical protein|nr:hypothetical protein [Bacteroidota bacterium]MBT6686852.1 hypothetical protein [Bacteroidota bacterium]MBT7144181.1 hypothetical protein [Bacteroidota bacterium]MBT7491900.1 hypothetical protein [Bacteroidota bacterium]
MLSLNLMIAAHVVLIIIVSIVLVKYGNIINTYLIRLFNKSNKTIAKVNNNIRISQMRKIEDSIERKHKRKKSHRSKSPKSTD